MVYICKGYVYSKKIWEKDGKILKIWWLIFFFLCSYFFGEVNILKIYLFVKENKKYVFVYFGFFEVFLLNKR